MKEFFSIIGSTIKLYGLYKEEGETAEFWKEHGWFVGYLASMPISILSIIISLIVIISG